MGRPGPNCKPRICKLCGQLYVPTSSHQSCCNRDIEIPCIVCGKPFQKKCTVSDSCKTCSEECNLKYQNMRREENAKKIKKICKCCGKEFNASSVRIVYCEGPHYKKCVICDNMFEFNPKTQNETQTCSKDCFVKLQLSHRDIQAEKEKQKQVLLEKYGVDNSALIPGSTEKAKQTMKEKYGREWYTQTQEYKDRIKETSRKKYGHDHWLSSEEVKQKQITTVRDKYGSDSVLSSEYGEQKIKEHWKQLGVENFAQLHIENLETWNKFKENPEQYIRSNYSDKVTAQQLAHDIGVSVPSINSYITEEIHQTLIKRNFSKMETAVSLMLQDLKPDIQIYHHCRKLIPPYEIDIYLPEYKIGIECNPTYTHNASEPDPWTNDIHDSKYHLMKTELAEKEGIFLFHLFGYEWNHKSEIIESMFRNLLGLNSRKIYARDTFVREVQVTECDNFLTENNLEDITNHDIKLGLYNSDELVFVMTFKHVDNNSYELSRFCSKLNTSVVGGFSKILNYFIKTCRPDSIITYSDRSHFQGSVFSKFRFEKVETTDPDYKLIDLKTDSVASEDSNADTVKVYDSGQNVYVLKI